MFRRLCGHSALQNAVIVTNMWDGVDLRRGNAREAELKSEDAFFKPVLDGGARMVRHDGTGPSAERIIRLILENHPLPLGIQEGLVDEHKVISETGAGEELNRELKSQIRRHQQETRVLMEEMERAIKEKDEETRKELEIETKRMQREILRFQNDARRLESDYKKEREGLGERLEQMQREISRFQSDSRRLESDYKKGKEKLGERLEQMESDARRETDRMAAQYQRQIDDLRNGLRFNAEALEREEARMIQEIDDFSSISTFPSSYTNMD